MALGAPPCSFHQLLHLRRPLRHRTTSELCRKNTALIPKSNLLPSTLTYNKDIFTPSTHLSNQHFPLQEITKLCESKDLKKALNLLEKTKDVALLDSAQKSMALGILLQACGVEKDIEIGTRVHEMIWASRQLRNDFVLNTRLITMYSTCGSLLDCRLVFDQLESKNLHQWNALLSGYTRNGLFYDAVCVFCELVLTTEYKPDNFTFPSVIKACGGFLDVGFGGAVQGMAVKMGLVADMFVGNALIAMYGMFGMPEKAKRVFEYMPERNLVSWNSIICVLSENGCLRESLDLFSQKLGAEEDLVPDSATLVTVLPVCAREGDVVLGKSVHGLTVKLGMIGQVMVSNALIDMYSKCGFLDEARLVFDVNDNKNVVTWNSLILGYSREGDVGRTFGLLRKMQMANDSLKANEVTLLNVLPVCLEMSHLSSVKELHGYSFRHRFENEELLANAFVAAYARCGSLSSSEYVFDRMDSKTVSSWNTLISAYVQNGISSKTFDLYLEMRNSGQDPDLISISSLLSACTQLKLLCFGKQIHAFVVRNGLESDLFISTLLLSLYFNCGIPVCAQVLFDNMENKSLVSWNAMVAGYSQNGLPGAALNVFRQMVSYGIQPNEISVVSVLRACSQLSALRLGREAHCFALKGYLLTDIFVNCSVIDMYAKSGSVGLSQKVFDQLQHKDSASCTVMISGYAIHGLGKEANELFEEMKRSGLKPDRFTFIGVLMACNHAGLIREGLKYFTEMQSLHGIEPELEHFACVIDMLGRAGDFADALDLVANMPVEPDARIWSSLLSSCRIHNVLDLGRTFAEKLLKLAPNRAETYVLISNLFAVHRKWDDVRRVRGRMKYVGLQKDVGCSWIEIEGEVHSFIVCDQMHPETEEIQSMWRRLEEKISKVGYLPYLGSVLHELKQEDKLEILRGHSEKLAISFGLLRTTKDVTLRVCKNLRICQDCHNAIKLISEVTGREIIVRDNKRFHHFREGFCSCGDYW